jgi:predicted cupin superfamily sugar epimerase
MIQVPFTCVYNSCRSPGKSDLIECATVYPGYEPDIQFRDGIDSLAQLPESEKAVDKS